MTYQNIERKSSDIAVPITVCLQSVGEAALQTVKADKEAKRERAIAASCLLLVKRGLGAHSSAAQVNAILTDGQCFRSDHSLWRSTGGLKNIYPRLVAGRILPAGILGEWSPDFIFGLGMSGALRDSTLGPSMWSTSSLVNRPAVEAAFLDTSKILPFHCIAYKCHNALTINGAWALRIGADDPEGIGVVAGMLAGGRRVIHSGTNWIGVTGKGQTAALLTSYGIPFIKIDDGGHHRYGVLLVSPFWGILLAPQMPSPFREWYIQQDTTGLKGHRKQPGMCPLLPWAFLKGAWGAGIHNRLPVGIVPLLIHRNSLRIHGIGQPAVREQAFRQFNFTRVDARLRRAWFKWMTYRGITKSDFLEGKVPLDFE